LFGAWRLFSFMGFESATTRARKRRNPLRTMRARVHSEARSWPGRIFISLRLQRSLWFAHGVGQNWEPSRRQCALLAGVGGVPVSWIAIGSLVRSTLIVVLIISYKPYGVHHRCCAGFCVCATSSHTTGWVTVHKHAERRVRGRTQRDHQQSTRAAAVMHPAIPQTCSPAPRYQSAIQELAHATPAARALGAWRSQVFPYRAQPKHFR